MFTNGQVVRCVVADALGITRSKYYTVQAVKDGWATVINDTGMASSYAQERFCAVDDESLVDDGYRDNRKPPNSPAIANQTSASAMASELLGTRQVILLVDDNFRLRATTAEQLRKLNYIVVEAENATKAMECLQADPSIQLLFTDIVMPGSISGFDLARTSVALRPNLKVLLTTGFTLARHSTQNVGWPLIGKPYRLREMARHIAELLYHQEASGEDQTPA